MSADLTSLQSESRVLFAIKLIPMQGQRFQPTGFPSLGAAFYRTPNGQSVLVESAQSMANRLEATIWNAATNEPNTDVRGISHVVVKRKGHFLTDTMLESHRLNSPYLLEGSNKGFVEKLKGELGALSEGPIDRKLLAQVLLKYDVGSLLHGVFLAKKELAGGRLRVARALTAFVEADGAETVASGGVKNDHVNPSGLTKLGYGNVPFARDEYTAKTITLYVNLDLAQIRGYGLGAPAERLLTLLGLYKVRALIDGDMRFRTACDLRRESEGAVLATRPRGFELPDLADLRTQLRLAIDACKGAMTETEVAFDDDLKKGRDEDNEAEEGEAAEAP